MNEKKAIDKVAFFRTSIKGTLVYPWMFLIGMISYWMSYIVVEFGRFAHRGAKKWNRKMETIYFLGFTHYCTRNRKGNFMVGRKTEKTRLKRSLGKLRELMRANRHHAIKDQVKAINQVLRGHYAYYGLGGNHKTLWKVYRYTEKYWHKMLCSRSWKSYIPWEKFNLIKNDYYPLQLPKLKLTFAGMQH